MNIHAERPQISSNRYVNSFFRFFWILTTFKGLRWTLRRIGLKNKAIVKRSIIKLVEVVISLHFYVFFFFWILITIENPCALRKEGGSYWNPILKTNVRSSICGNFFRFLNCCSESLYSTPKVELSSRKLKFEFLKFWASILNLCYIAN